MLFRVKATICITSPDKIKINSEVERKCRYTFRLNNQKYFFVDMDTNRRSVMSKNKMFYFSLLKCSSMAIGQSHFILAFHRAVPSSKVNVSNKFLSVQHHSIWLSSFQLYALYVHQNPNQNPIKLWLICVNVILYEYMVWRSIICVRRVSQRSFAFDWRFYFPLKIHINFIMINYHTTNTVRQVLFF